MPKVSVVLSCRRTDFLDDCIRGIVANAGTDDLEVVVVSPFEVTGEKVVWVEEKEKKGNIIANNAAYDAAAGEIIINLVDYVNLKPRAIANLVSFIEENEEKTFPFCASLFYIEFPIRDSEQARHWVGPRVGTVFGRHYPYFAAATRKSFEAAGGFFSTDYIGSFGDPDLGMRIWEAGGQVQLCWDAVVTNSPYRVRGDGQGALGSGSKDSFLQDMRTFLARWYKVYGEGWGIEFRRFNIDIPVFVLQHNDMAKLPEMIIPPETEDGFNIRLEDGTVLPFPRISF